MVDVKVLADLVEESTRELQLAEQELLATQRRVNALRSEVNAFRAVLARRTADSQDTKGDGALDVVSDGETADVDWTALPRTDAVDRALRTLAGDAGMSPAEVHSALLHRGRSDQRDHVSAALAHLKTRKRAHRGGYAKWLPGPAPEDAEGPTATAAGPSGLALLVEEGGTGSRDQTDDAYELGADDVHSHTQASVPDRGAPVVGFPN